MSSALGAPQSSKAKLFFLLAAIATVTLAHFAVPHPSHRQHVVHVILGGMYLMPIIASAIWFGPRGAVAITAVTSLAYYAHIRLSWRNQPMENANQLAMIAVYWIVAGVSGTLVSAQQRERARRLEVERRAERETVVEALAGLSNALGARDEYTREHSEHVARLALAIGQHRGLPAERLELLRLASLVHDIGKIGVRDDVLLKPQALTPQERSFVERHPVVAAEILRSIHGAKEIADIVSAHHECTDGSGYPGRRKAEQIPLEAQILRVADVFCSLTEKRIYHPAVEAEKAMEIMSALAGTKLDAASVQVLQRLVGEGLEPLLGGGIPAPSSRGDQPS